MSELSGPEAQLFHKRDPDFHHSPAVEHAVAYLQAHGQHIPNEPGAKIASYIDLLGDDDYVRDGTLTGDKESIDDQVEKLIVGIDDVSESYFELQRRIAREELGLGEIQIGPAQKRQMSEVVREDQRVTLTDWANYLNSEDANYPRWFRYYVFNGVAKLSEFDADEGRFRRRSRGTAANFPELNPEALAMVFDAVETAFIDSSSGRLDELDSELQQLARGGNFAKLYAYAMGLAIDARQEGLGTTEGSWTKYGQTGDIEEVRKLTSSLVGQGTSWCTAGESTATKQLAGGDFYVYYSRDKGGNDTVPRIAIRMGHGRVAEVRGIGRKQNMETEMVDIASRKLSELPGGEAYQRIVADMQKLTAIEVSFNGGHELDPHDIFFLRQYGATIRSFSFYGSDPRISQLLKGRDSGEDFDLMLTTYGHEAFGAKLLESGSFANHQLLVENLDKFEQVTLDHQTLIAALTEQAGGSTLILAHLEKFNPGAVDQHVLFDLLSGHYDGARQLLENVEKLDPEVVDYERILRTFMSTGGYEDVAKNLDIFAEFIDPVAFVRELIERKRPEIIADNLTNFNLTQESCLQIARILIAERPESLQKNIEDFVKYADPTALANLLMESGNGDILLSSLEHFDPKLVDQAALATDMIKRGQADVVINNLQRFQVGTVDQTVLFDVLMGARKLDDIANNIEKFESGVVDHAELCRILLEERRAGLLVENLPKFEEGSYDIQEVLDRIVANGQAGSIFKDAETVSAIKSLIGEQELIRCLLAGGQAPLIYRNLARFDMAYIDTDALAQGLIQAGEGSLAMKAIDRLDFTDLDGMTIASMLIDEGLVSDISSHLRIILAHADHKNFASLLITTGNAHIIANNIRKFEDGSVNYEEFVHGLIDSGNAHLIARNISRLMEQVNKDRLAEALIASGNSDIVARHLDKFGTGVVDHDILLRSLIQSGKSNIAATHLDARNLDANFQNAYILSLIEMDRATTALQKLDEMKPEALDYAVIADSLIKRGQAYMLARKLDQFPQDSVNHAELVALLLEEGRATVIVTHLEKFDPAVIDHKTLVATLLAQGDKETVVRKMDKLQLSAEDATRLARNLIGEGRDMLDVLTRNVSRFLRVMDSRVLAEALMSAGLAYMVEDNLDVFAAKAGRTAFAEFLEEVGFGYLVENHPQKFKQLDRPENI